MAMTTLLLGFDLPHEVWASDYLPTSSFSMQEARGNEPNLSLKLPVCEETQIVSVTSLFRVGFSFAATLNE